MNKLAVFDKADGINYIHPIIVNECRKFAEKELMPIGIGMGIDLLTKVDYNVTSFSYIDNSALFIGRTSIQDTQPKESDSMISIKKNDWGDDKSVVVFSPIINKLLDTEIYFKVTFEYITEDSPKTHSFWKFKISYCKDWYGDQEIAKEDIKLPIFVRPEYVEKLIKLDNTLWKCTFLPEIDMRDKCDVITEEENTEGG